MSTECTPPAALLLDFIAMEIDHKRNHAAPLRWYTLRDDLKEAARAEARRQVLKWDDEERRIQRMGKQW